MINRFQPFLSAFAFIAMAAATSAAQTDFSFTTLGGQTVSPESQRGKVVILLFSGVQDPQCRDSMRALAALADRYQGKDVRVYWVSINSVAEANDSQLQKTCGPSGSVVLARDQNQAAFKRFAGKNGQLPTVVVLNKQGQLQGQARGGFNPNSDFVNDLASIVDGLLSK